MPTPTINGSAIEQLAKLASRHRLIPFLGAGCSRRHLTVDWDGLRDEMAGELCSPPAGHLKVAQDYEARFGRKALCDFLRARLIVDKFDDSKGVVPLAVMASGIGIVYTTNQDNIFELCAIKYGRAFRRVVILNDLAEAAPADCLYFKYHGDLDYPDTLVFTKSDYASRISNTTEHFLDIRLRSDLLVKRFLFIGYSFRDPNIQLLLKELHRKFPNGLPESYLIAYDYRPELDALTLQYGVTVVDPAKEVSASTPEEAFEIFFSELSAKIVEYKTEAEVEELFRPSTPHAKRVVTYFEVRALKEKCAQLDLPRSTNLFRCLLDGAAIPKDFEADVVEIFEKLALRCRGREESDALNGAAFNLSLTELGSAVRALGAISATANARGGESIFDAFIPHVKGLPEKFRSLAVARAVELLLLSGQTISDSFRRQVDGWLRAYEDLPDEPLGIRSFIDAQIDKAWKGQTVLEHPLQRRRRIAAMHLGNPFGGVAKDFDTIVREMWSLMPKALQKPYEE
jgi:hypothetical protein